MQRSQAREFSEAAQEWYISAFDDEHWDACVCGQQDILFCYTIRNRDTSAVLSPIGSNCIKRFGNGAMSTEMSILSQRNKVFNNRGKKHDGRTYEWICANDPAYVLFLKHNGEKATYAKLVMYFDVRKRVLERSQAAN